MADKANYRMVDLSAPTFSGFGLTRITCWVDRPGICIGNKITLKTSDEPHRLWTVEHVFGDIKTKAELSDQSKWEVGGIQ